MEFVSFSGADLRGATFEKKKVDKNKLSEARLDFKNKMRLGVFSDSELLFIYVFIFGNLFIISITIFYTLKNKNRNRYKGIWITILYISVYIIIFLFISKKMLNLF